METFKVGGRWHWRVSTGATSVVLGEGYQTKAKAAEDGRIAEKRAAYTVYEVEGGSGEDEREPGAYFDVYEDGEVVRTVGPFADSAAAADSVEEEVAG